MPSIESRSSSDRLREFVRRSAIAALLIAATSPNARADAAETPTGTTEPVYTNRLIDSANPYLLQHAHNPVDWYPWGPEAFAKAKRENRPIFLSIGYSTCYWCHVAERTLFSDPRIAGLMNLWFVNIKVDREERPDLDAIYMLATGLITGGAGGWPNNVFLTPDLEPFYAGGYFPPEDDESGRPGFASVLTAIHDEWSDSPERMKQRAAGVTEVLRHHQARLPVSAQPDFDQKLWLSRVRESILKRFDGEYGGLGGTHQTTKFPQSPVLDLMLTDLDLNGDANSLRFLEVTLDAMAYGAIYDQLGGGFHRYSTERTWSIPHFEKMLYDNAQLLQVYARAWQHTQASQYQRIALGTRDYLRDRMMAPEGGFYTAEDAAVGGEEGASYLWSRLELEAVLGPAAADLLHTYSLTPMPEQPDPTNPDAAPGALRVGWTYRDDTDGLERGLATLAPQTRKLLSARDARPRPARDEKILVGWNGLAIDAFVVSGEVFHEPADIAIAKRGAERIWNLAWNAQNQQLSHEIFRGRAQGNGFLEDYALLGRSLLSLYRATGEEIWLQRAHALTDALLRRFEVDGSGVLTATEDGEALIVEPMDEGDGAYPSGTSAAVDLLGQLGPAAGEKRYTDSAARIARRANEHPDQWPALVAAVSANHVGIALSSEAVAAGMDQPIGETARHVHASATSRWIGTYREVVITLDIERGYHINANPASFDFLIPTSVTFVDVRPVEVRYPAPLSFKPRFAPDTLNVYEGQVQLIAKLEDGALDGLDALSATVDAQACTEAVCLPPSRIALTIHLDMARRQ